MRMNICRIGLRYDTIEEFTEDSKAECFNLAHETKTNASVHLSTNGELHDTKHLTCAKSWGD